MQDDSVVENRSFLAGCGWSRNDSLDFVEQESTRYACLAVEGRQAAPNSLEILDPDWLSVAD